MIKLVLAVAVIGAFGCGGKSSPGSSASTNEGIQCTIDDSCRPPPCGPCVSGTVITRSMLEQECATNPCSAPVAVCSANHVCVVK
jgi:hypothetical protein